MKSSFILLFSMSFFLAACQTTPKQYDGQSGYQIESQSSKTAVLSYTLAAHTSLEKNQTKLQTACQQVLGKHKNYKINILSQNDIVPPMQEQSSQGVNLGQSRTSFGFSNTPHINSNDGYATQQALETRPSIMKVIRYTCE